MNLQGWYQNLNNKMTFEEQTGVDDSGAATYGNRQSDVGCRADRHIIQKGKFQRTEREPLNKLSCRLEIAKDAHVRFWLAEDDDVDDSQAHVPQSIQPVYDKWGRFVHTVFWF